MKKNILLLSFLILLTNNLFGQGLRFGFQIESFLFKTKSIEKEVFTNIPISENNYYSHLSPFPSSIYLNLEAYATNKISFELKPGFIIADDYTGFEIGLFSKYKFYENLKAILFYNHHSNSGWGGSSNGGGGVVNKIGLLGIGAGIDLSKVTFIELLYSKPITESKIGSRLNLGEHSSFSSSNLTYVLKLGIGFNWKLTYF